jgi:hypothetical protein
MELNTKCMACTRDQRLPKTPTRQAMDRNKNNNLEYGTKKPKIDHHQNEPHTLLLSLLPRDCRSSPARVWLATHTRLRMTGRCMALEEILQVCTWRTALRRLAEIQRAGGSTKVRVPCMRQFRVASNRRQGWGRAWMESSRRERASSRRVDIGLRSTRVSHRRGGTGGGIVPGGQVTRAAVTCIIKTVMRSSAASRGRKEQPAVRAGASLRGLVACVGGCAQLIKGYVVARCGGVDAVGALSTSTPARQSLLVRGLC